MLFYTLLSCLVPHPLTFELWCEHGCMNYRCIRGHSLLVNIYTYIYIYWHTHIRHITYIYIHTIESVHINMHAFMHTLLSLIVMGISIQGLGTGDWTPRRRRRSCWTRPGALGKAASWSRDHVSKFDHLFGIFNRCHCEYRYPFISVSEYVLVHCITFHYSIVCKSTIDSFLDVLVMILYVIFVLRQ